MNSELLPGEPMHRPIAIVLVTISGLCLGFALTDLVDQPSAFLHQDSPYSAQDT